MIKILVNGAYGRMGRAMSAKILQEDDMQIVAAVDIMGAGTDIGTLHGKEPIGVVIENDLATAIEKAKPQVMLDFTHPQAVMNNIRTALGAKVACVVGTTGLTDKDLTEVEELGKANDTPIFAASNFAISAVLMMRFAAEAVKYMPQFEIVETHHADKLDAPSGTALTTAKMMCANRPEIGEQPVGHEAIPGCRGGEYEGAHIHSVRVPGVISMQDCIFGAPGQLLTIRAESTNAECFFPGVAMALRRVLSLRGLTFGLEKLMD